MDVTLIPGFIVFAVIFILLSITGKFSGVYLSSRMLGFDKKVSLRTGFSLLSSGESWL